MKIAVFDAKAYDRQFFEKWNEKYGADLVFFEEKLSLNNVMLTKYMDAVSVFVNDDVNEKVIDILARNGVRVIALRSAGYNNVDLKSAQKNRISVYRVPAYSPYAVAEHTLALLMTLNRKTHKAYNRTREGNFSLSGLTGFDLNGKTAGIIGTGKIARIFIKILRGLGVNVIAYDKFPNEQAAIDEEFKYVTLDELYANSDIISLHCPLTPETEHIIGYESMDKMKKGVIILNTGRGKLIDTSILIEALKDGRVGAAGLDVYEDESDYFFEDKSANVMQDDVLARLLAFNNVLLTSHQAFLTNEALDNIVETTLDNILKYASKEEVANVVWYDEETQKIVEGPKKK